MSGNKQEEENSGNTAVTSPSVEFLLKQIYIAHKGKVKALEADIHQLKSELLQEKNKEEECKQCKNLRSTLKRCKAEYSKALSKQKERIRLLELQLMSMQDIPVTKVNSNPTKRNENLPLNSSGDNELGVACKKIKKDQANKAENLKSTSSIVHQKEISGTYTISVFDDDCIKDNAINLEVQTDYVVNDKNDDHAIITAETVDTDVWKNEKFNRHTKRKEKLTVQTCQPKVIPETLDLINIDEIIELNDGLSLSSILKEFDSDMHDDINDSKRNEIERDNTCNVNQECHPSTSLSTDNSNRDIKMYPISLTNEEKFVLRNNIRKYFSKAFGGKNDLNDNLDASTVNNNLVSQGTSKNRNCMDLPLCEQQKILGSSPLKNEISSHSNDRCQNSEEIRILDVDATYVPLAYVVNERKLPSKGDISTEDIIGLDDDNQNDEVTIIGENISERQKSQCMLTGDYCLSEKGSPSLINDVDQCSFDRVPKKIVKYKFKEECVRKQDERRKLPGHDCKQCEQVTSMKRKR